MPGLGGLIGSWAVAAGIDQFGNAYPAGINVIQGQLTGVSITNAQIISSILTTPTINNPVINQGSISGTSVTESTITFDAGGGVLLVYSSSTNVTTISTPGPGTFTVPAGATVGKVEVWGGDGGGGGGNTTKGGDAGGGAAYSCEPNYSFVGRTTIPYNVGAGGTGGTTNNPGNDGGQTTFDNQGVIADAGYASVGGLGGQGGFPSTDTISFAGGNGGSNPGGFSSSAGGGGRAGSTGPGGNGGNPSSNAAPGTAGAAGTGTGGLAGGAGVLTATNGNNGGGGGAAGQGATGTTYINKFYDPTSTFAFYGAGVGGGQKNKNGSMYQGDPNVPLNVFPGDTFSYANYNHAQIAADFSGATIDSVKLTINNQHSWYNSGCYLILSYSDGGGDHYTGKYYWTPEGKTANINVSTPLNAQIKTLLAIKLGPSALTGNAFSLYNYGYYQGGAGQGGPRLTVAGHIGTTGLQTAGNGADGMLKVTTSTASTLIAAISPVAGTDASGNAFGAGYTGNVFNYHPGSSPTTVEVWQNITPPSGWAGVLRVKLLAEAKVAFFDMQLTHTALAAKTTVAFGTIAAAYRPLTGIALALVQTNNTAQVAPFPSMFIGSGGSFSAFNLDVGTTGIDCHSIYALD